MSGNSDRQPSWIVILVAIIGFLGAAMVCGVPLVTRLLDIYLAVPTAIPMQTPSVIHSEPSSVPTSSGSQNTPELVSTPTVDVPFIPASMCPGIIPRSLVEEWSKVGETTIDTTRIYIDEFDRMRTGGEFGPQDVLPPGVLIITDFGNGESFIYQSQPVRPIVHYRSWGIFETTGEYVATQSGSCMSIEP